jgi:glucokinase
MAKEVFKEFGIDLFEFLKPWLEKFGVEKIVLGGNISLADDLFVPAIKNALTKEGLSQYQLTYLN